MKAQPSSKQKGMTLFEVLIVVAVLAILAALLLPGLMKPKRYPRAQCINNLRMVGLSFRQWAIDNDGHFPMGVSMTNGGTMELASIGGTSSHYLVMSNDLNTPKILHCPQDEWRPIATSFLTNFTETNISYFVGLNATETLPSSFLTGDRNITNGILPANRILQLSSNTPIGWTEKLHDRQGNVGLADGSVHAISSMKLREYLANTGLETNRLAMPLE
jgi:prepilin-type N-terminal cleavage/methylation domain-containing protein